MEEKNVIKLPVTEDRRPATKRERPPTFDPTEEAQKRQKNVESLAALGETDGSVKLLEELVFGTDDELVEKLEKKDEDQTGTLLRLTEDTDEDSIDSENEEAARLQSSRKAAWVDEDDELEEEVDMKLWHREALMRGDAESILPRQKLQHRMREQFQKSMGGAPSWAESSLEKKKKKMKAAAEEEEEEEDDLLRRTGNFVASSDRLPSGVLTIKKCAHANAARRSEDRLTTVQFHPSAQVVMTAGLDQTVSLFQVDGHTNPKIQSLHLERFPVHRARFSTDGGAVIATGLRNKLFYLYDMMEGRVVPVTAVRGLNESRVKDFLVCPDGGALLLTGTDGYLHLLTLKTNEVVRSMKMNGSVGGVTFSGDGSKVFASSDEGEVFVWDLRSSRCVNRFSDDGSVTGTSIAASRDGRFLACGSQSGVVNIYSQDSCLTSAEPKPLKVVMNLLTSVTSLSFNHSSEILAVASRAEDEAVRLVHLPSFSIFSNFPVSKKKLVHRVSCLDFSPHGGFFSVANNKGLAPLFRLLHYSDF